MVDAFMGFTSLHLLLDLPKRSCMHFAPLCALHYAPCSISYVTRACVYVLSRPRGERGERA